MNVGDVVQIEDKKKHNPFAACFGVVLWASPSGIFGVAIPVPRPGPTNPDTCIALFQIEEEWAKVVGHTENHGLDMPSLHPGTPEYESAMKRYQESPSEEVS